MFSTRRLWAISLLDLLSDYFSNSKSCHRKIVTHNASFGSGFCSLIETSHEEGMRKFVSSCCLIEFAVQLSQLEIALYSKA